MLLNLDAQVTHVDTSLNNLPYFPGHFYCSGREDMLNDCFKAAMPPFRYKCQSLPRLSCKKHINYRILKIFTPFTQRSSSITNDILYMAS